MKAIKNRYKIKLCGIFLFVSFFMNLTGIGAINVKAFTAASFTFIVSDKNGTISGAKIKVTSGSTITASTDLSGSATLQLDSDVSYKYTVEANGYDIATGTLSSVTDGGSQSVILSLSSPVIVNQPTSLISISVGEKFSLNVKANYASSYQWQLNGVNIDSNTNPTAISNFLTVSNVQKADAGAYTCIVTGDGGQVTSNVATVSISKIATALAINISPNNIIVGEDVTITGTLSPNVADKSLLFSYGGKSQYATTDSNGSAKCTFKALSGTNSITASFAGGNVYTACQNSISFASNKNQSYFKFNEDSNILNYSSNTYINNIKNIAGDGTILYSSSDTTVARVNSNGVVTLTGAGNAVITATISSTDDYNSYSSSYTLKVNPIPLKVENIFIKNKMYDGTNLATYEKMPTLSGIINNDSVNLNLGVPTFQTYNIQDNIAISFTDFSLSGPSAKNYILKPVGMVTSSISQWESGTENYSVSKPDGQNGWFIKGKYNITAADGYLISTTGTANGSWKQSLNIMDLNSNIASDDTDTKPINVHFFIKDNNKGSLTYNAISQQLTDVYKKDSSTPNNLKITYSTASYKKTISQITFGLYKTPVEVKVSADDITSGLSMIQYGFKDSSGNINFDNTITKLVKNGDTYSAEFTINPSSKVQLVVKAIDNAGNSLSSTDNNGIVVDNKLANIVVTYTGKSNPKLDKYYNDRVQLKIDITEPNFDPSFVNLKIQNNSVDYDKNITSSENGWNNIEGNKWEKNIDLNDEGNYSINISYMNDNTGVYKNDIIIDKTAPIINVSYNNNEVKNGKYFNAEREAIIEVNEHNFNAADVNLEITATDGNGANINMDEDSTYIQNPKNWTTNGDVHIAKINFDKDGTYTFGITCQDMAGNDSAEVQFSEGTVAKNGFVIDTTLPQGKTVITKSVWNRFIQDVTFGLWSNNAISVDISGRDINGIDRIEYFTSSKKLSKTDLESKEDGWTISKGNVEVDMSSKAQIVYARIYDLAGNVCYINS